MQACWLFSTADSEVHVAMLHVLYHENSANLNILNNLSSQINSATTYFFSSLL